jgi:MFS family permease
MLVAYAVNELGTWLGYVALAVGVYDHTHSPIATAALFIARGLLPAALSPLLVTRIERSSRRGGLASLYLLEGVLTAGLAALMWRFWLPGVLCLFALDGVAAVAATALIRASAAQVSGEEGEAAQRQATATINVVFMFAFAVGPALGGAIVHIAGGPFALLLDSASFLLSGALLLRISVHVSTAAGNSIKSRLAGAARHVFGMPALRTLLATEAVAIVFFASVEPVEVVYAKSTLSAGDLGLGLLLGIWGAGAALGSVLFARSGSRPLGSMLTFGTLCVGLAYLGFAVSPSIAPACVAALLGGIGNGIQWPALVSAVQRLTPADMQGRLMSAIGSITALCPAIGFALGGVIAAATSTRIAMLCAGVVATLATSAFLRLWLRGPLRDSYEGAERPSEALTL